MQLPSAEDYLFLIEKKDPHHFASLNDYTFLSTEPGNKKVSIFHKGNSCVIFKAARGNHLYAVRCFLRGDRELFRRYSLRAVYLSSREPGWKVPFEFFENEIFMEGQQYPVVVMDWIESVPLNEFIDGIVNDANKITRLQEKILDLSASLEENEIGHGDLNFNHLRVQSSVSDFDVKLLDYDSMFVPELREQDSQDSGSPGFQHPRRLATDFSETIDRFSIWVLLTALEAIKTDPLLWKDNAYRNNRHLLFTLRDLILPGQSKIFQRLKNYRNEALNYYTSQLIHSCQLTNLSEISKPELYKKGVAALPLQYPIAATESEPNKLFDIEIKTIPAGKDVLVAGQKKGITPLRLTLAKKDFTNVVVVHENEKTPLTIEENKSAYELDFIKKKNTSPLPVSDPDEILEFGADRYSIREGELSTLRWKVKGNGKIHITNLGEVDEKNGRKKVVLKHTTNYVLTVGSKSRSLTIHVSPKPVRPILVNNDSPIGGNVMRSGTRTNQIMKWVGLACLTALVVYLLVGLIMNRTEKNDTADSVKQSSEQNSIIAKDPFTSSRIQTFLAGLYKDYNDRNLPAIMENYAPRLEEYYDSGPVTNDSLGSIINDLFIKPAFYECSPDLNTLSSRPANGRCTVSVTINEVLQKDNASPRQTYATKVEYVVNEDLKILSEKGLE